MSDDCEWMKPKPKMPYELTIKISGDSKVSIMDTLQNVFNELISFKMGDMELESFHQLLAKNKTGRLFFKLSRTKTINLEDYEKQLIKWIEEHGIIETTDENPMQNG